MAFSGTETFCPNPSGPDVMSRHSVPWAHCPAAETFCPYLSLPSIPSVLDVLPGKKSICVIGGAFHKLIFERLFSVWKMFSSHQLNITEIWNPCAEIMQEVATFRLNSGIYSGFRIVFLVWRLTQECNRGDIEKKGSIIGLQVLQTLD